MKNHENMENIRLSLNIIIKSIFFTVVLVKIVVNLGISQNINGVIHFWTYIKAINISVYVQSFSRRHLHDV